jgi:uncharacterized protein
MVKLLNFIKAEINVWVFHPSLWTRKLLTPKIVIQELESLDAQRLKNAGIEAIAIDYDGVIVAYHSLEKPEESKVQKIRELSQLFTIGILSNRKGKLLQSLEDTLGELNLPILKCEKMKPHPDAYHNAAICLSTPVSKTAIVEDRLVTGIAGANKLGMYTIWISSPVKDGKEPWNVRIYRIIEEGLMRFYKWLSGN